jgi:hypothetical protein
MHFFEDPTVWAYYKLTFVILLVEVIFYLLAELYLRSDNFKDFLCTLCIAVLLFSLGVTTLFGVATLCAFLF